jgi:hypothetical protein
MNPDDLKSFFGVRPDINIDNPDPSQITEEISYIYKLIKSNKLDGKATNLSKAFYLSEEFKMLQEKKKNDNITDKELEFLTYLRKYFR